MKKLADSILFLIIIFFISACLGKIEKPRDRNDLPVQIRHLQGSVYLVQDPNYWQSNTVIYISKAGTVFFNSGWSYKSARQIVWKASTHSSIKLIAVVPTSFMLHHTNGLPTFFGSRIQILMHRKTPILISQYWNIEHSNMKKIFNSWRQLEPVRPNAVFGEKFSFLKGKIKLYHFGPGHTPDNVVVHFPEEKLIYAGGLLSIPLRFTQYSNRSGWLENLNKIDKLEFNSIISGHGQALRNRIFLGKVRNLVQKLPELNK